MSVSRSDLKVGGYYATATDQLRKITKIEQDAKGRDRVSYVCKSIKVPASGKVSLPFGYGGGTKANPPLADTFVKACDRILTTSEVSKLRKDGVLLSGE